MSFLQKLSDLYFSRRALPYWCILLIDCAAVAFSFYLTFYLRYGGSALAGHFWALTFGTLVSLIPFVVSFRIFHTYTGIVRYSSFEYTLTHHVLSPQAGHLRCLVVPTCIPKMYAVMLG